MSSNDSKSLARAYERDIPGYRAATSPALQKRKASHTLAPSNLSQSKKHRSSSGDEVDIGAHSLVAACSHLPQEVSELTTPKTPIRESFPSADQLDPQVTPLANKTTATEDPVAGSPPTTPTSANRPRSYSQIAGESVTIMI
ncbi:hypothetical protein FRC12_009953 [Ceratobasidium sp. 428]|nr:hypothetical protein FRC12_009953 [Ceratobasidium sp. 428]